MLIFQKIFLDHIKSILFYFYFIWCSSNFGFSCPCKKDKSLFPQVLSFSPLQTFYKFHSQTLCMIINLKLSQYSKIISFLSVSMLSWYFLDLVDSPLWIHDESKLICSFNFELTFAMTWLVLINASFVLSDVQYPPIIGAPRTLTFQCIITFVIKSLCIVENGCPLKDSPNPCLNKIF